MGSYGRKNWSICMGALAEPRLLGPTSVLVGVKVFAGTIPEGVLAFSWYTWTCAIQHSEML